MKLTIREIAIFGMLGSIMYASKFVMELFPNVHLHLCDPERYFLRFRDLVDSLFICMDNSLGCRYAPSPEYAEKNPPVRLYGSMRGTRFSIWHIICSGTGAPVRSKLPGNDRLDRRGTALGFHSRHQQFSLRDPDHADHIHLKTGRKKRGKDSMTESFPFLLRSFFLSAYRSPQNTVSDNYRD